MKKFIVIFVGISMFLSFLSYGEEKPKTVTPAEQKELNFVEYLNSLPTKPNLYDVKEISVLIGINDEGLALLGVRKEDIENEVIVLLKSKLSKIKIVDYNSSSRSNVFWVAFTLANQKSIGDEELGCAGMIDVQLYNGDYIIKYYHTSSTTGVFTTPGYFYKKWLPVVYWEDSMVFFYQKSYWGKIKEELEQHFITSFAASWYKDNPE